jgi:hypothetical protein
MRKKPLTINLDARLLDQIEELRAMLQHGSIELTKGDIAREALRIGLAQMMREAAR